MMTIPDNKVIFNEIIIYVFVGLFGILTALSGWIAVQTIEMIRVTTSIQEHSRASDGWATSMSIQLSEQSRQIGNIQLMMAEHGWGVRDPEETKPIKRDKK